MTKKYFRLFALILSCLLAVQAVAQSGQPADAAKVKQKLTVLGTGSEVRLTETGGQEITGAITAIGDTAVTLQAGSAAPVEIPYSQVTGVHAPRLTRKTGVLVAVVAVAAVVGIIVGIVVSHGSH